MRPIATLGSKVALNPLHKCQPITTILLPKARRTLATLPVSSMGSKLAPHLKGSKCKPHINKKTGATSPKVLVEGRPINKIGDPADIPFGIIITGIGKILST